MTRFSCVVIGDAALTVRCARAIVAAGHELSGIVTEDDRCAAWGAGRGIPVLVSRAGCAPRRDALDELTRRSRVDYLFSVHNVRILPADVLAFAERAAINYHDALLPRYAGLHAGSWAIIRGEAVHGVTWHRMTAGIDDGEILAQRSFALAGDETAWSLGGRCTEAAIEAFAELLERLSTSRIGGTPQNLDARSYFAGWKLPAPGCVLRFDDAAVNVVAMVRALDFGAADNPMGIPKVIAGDDVFLVSGAEILDRRSEADPASVVSSGGSWADVSTRSFDVRLWLTSAAARDGVGDLARLEGTKLRSATPDDEWITSFERRFRRHERYWMERFGRLAPLLPAGLSGSPAAVSREVRLDLSGLGLGGRRGTDRAHDALAALAAWLRLEVGQPFDVAFGEPELTREIVARGLETLVVARPPLRVDLSTGETLAQYSARLREERDERRSTGTCAIDLPRRVRRLRSASRFFPAVAVDLLDETGEAACQAPDMRGVDLAVSVTSDGTGVTFRSREGGEGALERLTQRFMEWLHQVEAAWDRAIRPGHAGEAVADLHDMFARRAASDPSAVAVESDDSSWTYGELAERVGRVSAALRRRGVGAESLVALRAERLVDLVTAMLGVLGAGGAFLVIDPAEPAARARRMLADAAPDLLFGEPAIHALGPDVPYLPLAICDAVELPAVDDARFDAGHLAYVAFTSGSTGAPKGVAVERGALSHYVAVAGRGFGLGPGDRVLQLGSPAFDLAYEQIFGALCHGATLVATDGRPYAGTEELFATCVRHRVTLLDLPTHVWARAAKDVARAGLEIPATIRLTVIGGDEARASDVRGWVGATRGRSGLLNSYGPTEATIVATTWTAPLDPDAVPDAIPIGVAIDGVEAVVLDESGASVPDGEEGELWLGGVGLARGYHRRPDLTAERFLAFGGQRLYRTGDRARRRPDGMLEYLGRVDRQLKIGGRRVDPGELEAAFLAHADVVDVAAGPIESADGRPGLGAWVVLREGAQVARVRQAVAERLPSFLRPSRVEQVEALPRLTGGKVDLEGLRRGTRGDVECADESFDPVERELAAIWRRVLGCGAIGRDDDFFELGGDSLSAVDLLASIEVTFGTRLPFARLMREVTLCALARDIRDGRAGRPGCVIPLQPDGDAPPLFCVHGLGGHLLRLTTLADELRPDQPFLGLQSPGLDDDDPVPETVDELARHFLREATLRIGGGPLHVVGMSFGGIVALEMARQALEQGRAVGLVAMFDTYLSEVISPPEPPTRMALLRHRARRAIGDRLGRARRRLRRLAGGPDRIEKANEYRNFTRVMEANDEAMRRYRLGRYDGRVTFFAASQRDRGLFDELERRTGCTLEIVPVPGDHLTMYDPPNVSVLAGALRRAMGSDSG
jgi:amino acid adenylation domain-containing protein